jgi:hypothetical protein
MLTCRKKSQIGVNCQMKVIINKKLKSTAKKVMHAGFLFKLATLVQLVYHCKKIAGATVIKFSCLVTLLGPEENRRKLFKVLVQLNLNLTFGTVNCIMYWYIDL